MSISAGTRLGPYEIVAPLGAGGMGEVYRARDTRLGRDVAIKVLPSSVTATAEVRARFEREARAISHLNHPNVCTLHDVGREGDTDFLVMELVSGGSLRERLARKGLSADQVLALGIEIADALEAAHRRGIVHRDLKPSNILLTERGQAKVMDFGLATAFRRGAKASESFSASAGAVTERDEPLTSPGQVVGTVAYMSPEQARGEEVDARSDIFSLGSVLYEMASGHRAFEGSSTAVIFEAILNRTPAPVSLMREGVPAELDRILGKALEKDRELRYQTAAEVRTDLKRLKRELESRGAGAGAAAGGDSGSRHSTARTGTLPASVIARRRLVRIAWAGVVVVGLAGGALVSMRLGGHGPPPDADRLSIEAPPTVLNIASPRISPDGRLLAFQAQDSTSGLIQIWIRPLDGTSARPLQGTEGAYRPFWSPDSRSLGYVLVGEVAKVMRIEATGVGHPVTICDKSYSGGDKVSAPSDGSWGTSGIILLDGFDTIRALKADGGELTQVTWLDRSRGETGHSWPAFLQDGKHFLYLATLASNPDSVALRVAGLGSKESKILAVDAFSRVEYVSPGYVLFLRGRTLFAQPFDEKRLRLAGPPIPILDDVQRADQARYAEFSASATGTLVYLGEVARGKTRMVWMNRAGRQIGTLGPAADFQRNPSLSPDEKRAAVAIVAPGENLPDLWIFDVDRDVTTRFTSDPGGEVDAVWSPDGSTVYYHGWKTGHPRVWVKASSGIGEDRELEMPPGSAWPSDVSRDGRLLFAVFKPPGGGRDIAAVSLGSERRTELVLAKGKNLGYEVNFPALSPDGKWLAYQSDESGQQEVYVLSYPSLAAKHRISASGGLRPRWRADGREVFYWQNGGLMAAAIDTRPMFRVGAAVRLFDVPYPFAWASTNLGNRFLVNVPAKGEKLPPFTVVLSWPSLLRKGQSGE